MINQNNDLLHNTSCYCTSIVYNIIRSNQPDSAHAFTRWCCFSKLEIKTKELNKYTCKYTTNNRRVRFITTVKIPSTHSYIYLSIYRVNSLQAGLQENTAKSIDKSLRMCVSARVLARKEACKSSSRVDRISFARRGNNLTKFTQYFVN